MKLTDIYDNATLTGDRQAASQILRALAQGEAVEVLCNGTGYRFDKGDPGHAALLAEFAAELGRLDDKLRALGIDVDLKPDEPGDGDGDDEEGGDQ